jgi:hypothetical protein
MTIPNLAGIVTKDDVFSKGTGSYAASYVSWARIAMYLHSEAPGWEFALREAPDGGHVWKAPDGSGYVVSYFIGPERQFTPDFVFPCQDNRNAPISLDKISCRTLTDTHRRALCANAAFTFGLGGELWAKLEVADADPAEASVTASAPPAAKSKPKPAPAPAKSPAAKADPVDTPLNAEERKLVLSLLMDLKPDQLNPILEQFRAEFSIKPDIKTSTAITTEAHANFIRGLMEQL